MSTNVLDPELVAALKRLRLGRIEVFLRRGLGCSRRIWRSRRSSILSAMTAHCPSIRRVCTRPRRSHPYRVTRDIFSSRAKSSSHQACSAFLGGGLGPRGTEP
jgi:1,2-phenylacetyl-CoA epoxidase PaaB subunit